MESLTDQQRAVCRDHGAAFLLLAPGSTFGVALQNTWPSPGARRPSAADRDDVRLVHPRR